jgi:hypothetical protein
MWLIWALCRGRRIEKLRQEVESARPAAIKEIEEAKRERTKDG